MPIIGNLSYFEAIMKATQEVGPHIIFATQKQNTISDSEDLSKLSDELPDEDNQKDEDN